MDLGGSSGDPAHYFSQVGRCSLSSEWNKGLWDTGANFPRFWKSALQHPVLAYTHKFFCLWKHCPPILERYSCNVKGESRHWVKAISIITRMPSCLLVLLQPPGSISKSSLRISTSFFSWPTNNSSWVTQ